MPDLEYTFEDTPAASAEEPAAEPAETEAAEQQEAPPARERDDRGRFVPRQTIDEVLAEERGISLEDPDPETDPAPLIGGKFKSTEDLLKSYQELEAKQGVSSSQVQALEARLAALEAGVTQTPTPQYQDRPAPLTEAQADALDRAAVENPQETALWALENRPDLYERVLKVWASGDPESAFEAARFDARVALYEQERKLQEEIGAPVSQLQEGAQETERERWFAGVWQKAVGEDPELRTLHSAITKAAEEFPLVAAGLETTNEQVVRNTLQALKMIAQGHGNAAVDAAKQADHERAELARLAKLDARVGTAGFGRQPGDAAREDALKRYKDSIFKQPSTDISSGFTYDQPRR